MSSAQALGIIHLKGADSKRGLVDIVDVEAYCSTTIMDHHAVDISNKKYMHVE
jgi:hypothetical protein